MSFKDQKPETNCHFDNQITYLAADMDKYLGVVEPMAEKWEQLRGADGEHIVHGSLVSFERVQELLKKEEKLEAIKTWLKNAKAQGRISMSDGMKLDEILEAS